MGLNDVEGACVGSPGNQGGDENRRTVCYHSGDKIKLYPIPKWAIEMVEEGSERVMMVFLSIVAVFVILILFLWR